MGVLLQLVTALVGWFASYVTRRTASVLAFLTLMAAIVGVLLTALGALVSSLDFYSGAGSSSVAALLLWLKFLFPTNAKVCVSTLIAYQVAMRLFEFERRTVEIAAISDNGISGGVRNWSP